MAWFLAEMSTELSAWLVFAAAVIGTVIGALGQFLAARFGKPKNQDDNRQQNLAERERNFGEAMRKDASRARRHADNVAAELIEVCGQRAELQVRIALLEFEIKALKESKHAAGEQPQNLDS